MGSRSEAGDATGVPLDTTDTAASAEAPTTAAVGGTQVGGPRAGSLAESVAPASKAPIVLGQAGNFSGIAGAAYAPARDAVGAWAQMVNARGGINGHPVKLLTADDGGDSSIAMANVRNFVENQGAIALVNLYSTTPEIVSYAQEKGIPIIGGSGLGKQWSENPVMFSAVTSDTNQNYGWAAASAGTGAKKVASVYCSEGAICKEKNKEYVAFSRQFGLEVVYQGAVSLAQPDYTADCINARNAGAELIVAILDGASANRVAQSCGRQGYKPIFVISKPADAVVPETEGAISPLVAFPWFLRSGTPELQEFGDAMAKFAPGVAVGPFTTQGWVSAKLAERAAAKVSDTPTSQDLFRGLWKLKGETFGGLSVPLTFIEGKPAPEASCVFVIKVSGGRWTAPTGLGVSGCR